jgi:hypothetical protein
MAGAKEGGDGRSAEAAHHASLPGIVKAERACGRHEGRTPGERYRGIAE